MLAHLPRDIDFAQRPSLVRLDAQVKVGHAGMIIELDVPRIHRLGGSPRWHIAAGPPLGRRRPLVSGGGPGAAL